MSAVEIIQPSVDEYNDLIEAEVRDAVVGVRTVDEFIAGYMAGRLDEADAEVARMAALLGLGQNGR